MKIVIAGTGKSGTTALAYKIAAPLADCAIVFEPVQRRPAAETGKNTVVKIRLALAEPYADYDRKILLIRDPRDWLISHLLYHWYSRNTPQQDYQRFMTLLERKEREPSSLALVDLMPPSNPLEAEIQSIRAALRLSSRLIEQGWFRFRYEDMVNGEIAKLNTYLGFSLDPTAEVADKHRRVVRSKAAGNWRHWLTPKDVALLRPLLNESLRELGYTDDWQLAEPQTLDPALGSAYVRSLRGTQLQRWYRVGRRFIRRLFGY